jgi:PEP-CTERM motif
LLTINTTTGVATSKGPFGFTAVGQDGMDIDPLTGTIWSIAEVEGRTYTLDPSNGHATIQATLLTCNGVKCTNSGGFNSLAIPVPEPEGYALALAGLGVVGLVLRRNKSA